MNILHYSLGLPPFRTGGMTKFCVDLMEAQLHRGGTVSLLWPGRIVGRKTRIKKRATQNNINCYEIVNPCPVPYDEGITEFGPFLNDGDIEVYIHYLSLVKPDIIHIHTFIGLHASLVYAAKQLNIRTIYSTHDFFPICARLTMFRGSKPCKTVETCNECPACNAGALSMTKMKILQSPLYERYKDAVILKKLRAKHRDQALSGTPVKLVHVTTEPSDYLALRSHYSKILHNISYIHFNSTLTQSTYEQYFGKLPGEVIPITHSEISDNRKRHKYREGEVNLLYMGQVSASKGFYLLKDALDKLNCYSIRFRLHIFVNSHVDLPYAINHGRYSYEQLSTIMEKADAVIVPSLLSETFGYTALEAMSYAVPVILSSTIGAKDIVPKGGCILFESGNLNSLINSLDSLSAEKLSSMNKVLLDNFHVPLMRDEEEQIRLRCYL